MGSESPLIIDCDCAPDDLVNVLLLERTLPGCIELLLTSYGCTTSAKAAANLAGFLHSFKCRSIPLVQGASEPLQPHPVFGSAWPTFFGSNGANDVVFPAEEQNWAQPGNSELFCQTVAQQLHKLERVKYLLTGPCTNLARLLQYDAALVQRHVSALYIMGGVFFGAGNSGPVDPDTGRPAAEFNFYLDPTAVQTVLSSGLPIFLVSWDESKQFHLPLSLVQTLQAESQGSALLLEVIRRFFVYYPKEAAKEGAFGEPTMCFPDVLTGLACLGYGSQEQIKISINTAGLEAGRAVISDSGTAVQYLRFSTPERGQGVQLLLKHTGLRRMELS